MRSPYLRAYRPRTGRIPRVRKREESVQKQVCNYVRKTYPQVIFRSDYASGLVMTPAQAVTHASLQSSRSWPDLFIYEPRTVNGKHYCGLALELKKDGTPVILKIGPRKGMLSTDPHIQEQAHMLRALIKKGYYANFAVGLEAAKRQIDWYMGRVEPENGELF